ncbi:MAG: hypothetical protein Q8L21_00725 [Candidatus Komeilibacteria bacterium]|nr:hypothetical protein [Candidatus Komeilibacteria bacterium]
MIVTICHKIKNNQTGQGLLETIISLGIITSGIIGMLSLTVSNQTASVDSSEKLIATNLAREGIELVRNRRDSNWLPRQVWDQGLENGNDYTAVPLFDSATDIWTLDFTPNDLDHNYTRLWRKGGVYFQSTEASPALSILTAYRRILQLDEICADKTVVESGASCPPANPKIGIKAQAIIEWQSKSNTDRLVAEERLFNWR